MSTPYIANAAVVLRYLGFQSLTDFSVVDNGDGTTYVTRWSSQQPQPTPSEVAAAELPATKEIRIAAINAECRTRLLARFGDAAEQVSRSIGVYGATEKAALENGISATIDASNAASDSVLAATTVAQVEAVTVTWPVI
jgi:hypothetical protein